MFYLLKHITGGLNNNYLFLIDLEAGNPEIKMSAVPVSGETQIAIFSCIFTWWRTESAPVSFSSYKDTDPIMGVHSHAFI